MSEAGSRLRRARAARTGTLERALVGAFPGLDGASALAALAEGRVFAEGRRARRGDARIEAGATLIVHPPGSAGSPPPVPVLFEDETWLVVDKPAGLAVNPSETSPRTALVELFEDRDARVVHRLDRDTTGVLVLAKGAEAAAELSRAFAERRADKTYLAVVEGGGLDELIEAPIGKDKRRPRARAVRRDGQPARTVVRTLGVGGELALLELRPETGRTHQIRVHLAHRGRPIFGDALYGGPAAVRLGDEVVRAERPLLHALRLALPGPDGPRSFEAAPPEDLAALTRRLGP